VVEIKMSSENSMTVGSASGSPESVNSSSSQVPRNTPATGNSDIDEAYGNYFDPEVVGNYFLEDLKGALSIEILEPFNPWRLAGLESPSTYLKGLISSFLTPTISEKDEKVAQELIDAVNEAPFIDEAVVTKKRMHPSYMAELISDAKMKYPLMQDTRADRICLSRFFAAQMTEHGMRTTHQSAMLPLLLELFFVPSDAELLGLRIRQSLAFSDRRHESQVKYTTRSSPWLFNWFGSARSRYEPAEGL